MTDAEILAKGPPSVILLSEAKRFTIDSNSVKSNQRFKRIVDKFHTKNEFLRIVRALFTLIYLVTSSIVDIGVTLDST
jgi:hypothetical protein